MYISPYCRLVCEPPIYMKFGVRGHLTDIITCVKFLVDRFRGYGVLIPPKLPFPIDLLLRPYNSVTLPCDTVIIVESFISGGSCECKLLKYIHASSYRLTVKCRQCTPVHCLHLRWAWQCTLTATVAYQPISYVTTCRTSVKLVRKAATKNHDKWGLPF